MKLTMLIATNTRRTGAQVLAGPGPHRARFEQFRRMKKEGAAMPEGFPVLALLDVNTGITLAVPIRPAQPIPPGAREKVVNLPRRKRAAGDGQADVPQSGELAA